MKRIAIAFLVAAFAVSPVYAQSCASKAVGKDGKPLAGAAKTSFMKNAAQIPLSAKTESRSRAQPRRAMSINA